MCVCVCVCVVLETSRVPTTSIRGKHLSLGGNLPRRGNWSLLQVLATFWVSHRLWVGVTQLISPLFAYQLEPFIASTIFFKPVVETLRQVLAWLSFTVQNCWCLGHLHVPRGRCVWESGWLSCACIHWHLPYRILCTVFRESCLFYVVPTVWHTKCPFFTGAFTEMPLHSWHLNASLLNRM